MFQCFVSPILSEIESQFLLMEDSPHNSLQIILEFSGATLLQLTMFMRKKYKIITCASVTMNIEENYSNSDGIDGGTGCSFICLLFELISF